MKIVAKPQGLTRLASMNLSLTENGIPDEVLAKLLPGDDVIELSEPTIAGGIGYRFAKRAFDIVSCGCALILLAIPMGVMALKLN